MRFFVPPPKTHTPECPCETRQRKENEATVSQSTFFPRLKKRPSRSSIDAMVLFRGRRGILILASMMLVTGSLNTIATKLQVHARLESGLKWESTGLIGVVGGASPSSLRVAI